MAASPLHSQKDNHCTTLSTVDGGRAVHAQVALGTVSGLGLSASLCTSVLPLTPAAPVLFAATALMFSPQIKLGVLPENTLTALLNDRLVQKGTVLEFVTVFFKVRPLFELVALLVFVALMHVC